MVTDDTVVTFDLFSALLDSRSGASRVLDGWAATRGWSRSGGEVYDAWDSRNKEAQRTCAGWVSYRRLAVGALADTYTALGLAGDPTPDLDALVDSLPDWPLWPDVEGDLPALERSYRVGLLSNVDDEMFGRTQAAQYVPPQLAMTSQRLGVYKPDPRIYRRAQEALGSLVHVATSARDVRGALEARIPVIRLRRPGHALDPEGPAPTFEASVIGDLAELVEAARTHAR